MHSEFESACKWARHRAEMVLRVVHESEVSAVLGGVQYNYFLHSVPHDRDMQTNTASYHWHLEITPRTSIPTGFELGSGLFVSTISPEEAAEQLRAVVLE